MESGDINRNLQSNIENTIEIELKAYEQVARAARVEFTREEVPRRVFYSVISHSQLADYRDVPTARIAMCSRKGDIVVYPDGLDLDPVLEWRKSLQIIIGGDAEGVEYVPQSNFPAVLNNFETQAGAFFYVFPDNTDPLEGQETKLERIYNRKTFAEGEKREHQVNVSREITKRGELYTKLKEFYTIRAGISEEKYDKIMNILDKIIPTEDKIPGAVFEEGGHNYTTSVQGLIGQLIDFHSNVDSEDPDAPVAFIKSNSSASGMGVQKITVGEVRQLIGKHEDEKVAFINELIPNVRELLRDGGIISPPYAKFDSTGQEMSISVVPLSMSKAQDTGLVGVDLFVTENHTDPNGSYMSNLVYQDSNSKLQYFEQLGISKEDYTDFIQAVIIYTTLLKLVGDPELDIENELETCKAHGVDFMFNPKTKFPVITDPNIERINGAMYQFLNQILSRIRLNYYAELMKLTSTSSDLTIQHLGDTEFLTRLTTILNANEELKKMKLNVGLLVAVGMDVILPIVVYGLHRNAIIHSVSIAKEQLNLAIKEALMA